MRVADLGENNLIQRLSSLTKHAGRSVDFGNSDPLLLGPGDDAAVYRADAGIFLATTDTAVEGVHFTRDSICWQDLGWKVMACNLSDIAAMGGVPLHALVTLGLPMDTEINDIDELYAGMIESSNAYLFTIAGGDVVHSNNFFISIALIGHSNGTLLKRSEAEVGDLLAVTGHLGSSSAGLRILNQRKDQFASDSQTSLHTQRVPGFATITLKARSFLINAHRRPTPRLSDGHTLLKHGVKAAMDISDGLLLDLTKMMTSSGTMARIESWKVPIHPHTLRTFPADALMMSLTGGEDYHLLFSASPQVMEQTLVNIPQATIIGTVVDGPPGHVSVVDKQNKEFSLDYLGWEHFRS
ncbi:MAG: thiamine-phosphate kinase [SAR202 cluster bacterium Io17-Chloro-G3]|nr:MAG: thiamine-phosphate kinase [SAR202 cluster bacterium Io17-Chloro-G3]